MLRCAITPGVLALEHDRAQRPKASATLLARCRELAAEGVQIILVREKYLPAGELTEFVSQVVHVVDKAAARVVVAQRTDIAIAAGATGVHLSAASGELTPSQVRQVMPAAFISVSCHTVEEVRRATAGGADAVLFAPVFGKMINPEQSVPAVGLEALRLAAQAAGTVPVFALGGVTERDVDACLGAGAAGVAGIRLFFA